MLEMEELPVKAEPVPSTSSREGRRKIPVWNIVIIILVSCLLLIPQYRYVTGVAKSWIAEQGESSWNQYNEKYRALIDDDDNHGEDNTIPLAQPPLNIIILYPDDWRHDDLGDANPDLQTPTFSALAADGIRFTYNAVTTSICWISRATLFTGLYVSGHRSTYLFRPIFAHTPEIWHKTWPYLLQQAGYWVGHIGKWQYQDKDNYKKQLFNFSVYFEGWITKKSGGNTEFIADVAGRNAISFLRKRPKDRPFAATVAFYPPKGIHDPQETLSNFTRQYSNHTYVEKYNVDEAYRRLPVFLQDNDTEARRRYIYRYEKTGNFQNATVAQYATITHLDKICGDIVAELKRQGIYNHTMIIVTADNGEFHGRHAFSDKWYPYHEAIRVPLIIYDPRMPVSKRGTLNDEFTLNIDLAPTILGAAGLEAPSVMHGRDIADLYLSENPTSSSFGESWRQEFYYEFPQINDRIPPSVALVRKDYKYIDWWLHKDEELFDMQQDPFELNNIANKTDLADLKKDMYERLHSLRHEVFGSLGKVPGTQCDPTLKAGSVNKNRCSQIFPDRCCPAQKER